MSCFFVKNVFCGWGGVRNGQDASADNVGRRQRFMLFIGLMLSVAFVARFRFLCAIALG